VQIVGDPLPFIFPDGDFGKDFLPLQPHVTTVIPDNGNKKINDDYRKDKRHQDSNIKDLRFHHSLVT
jgi:hypothetical protein